VNDNATFEMMELATDKVYRMKFCARELKLSSFVVGSNCSLTNDVFCHNTWNHLPLTSCFDSDPSFGTIYAIFFSERIRQCHMTTEERNRQNTIAKNQNRGLAFPGLALQAHGK
jgi:hypothetical protein